MTLVAAYANPVTRQVHMMADTHAFDSTQCYPNVRKIERHRLYTPAGHSAGQVLIGHAGEDAVGWVVRNLKMPQVTIGADPVGVADRIAAEIQKLGAETPGGLNYHGGSDQIYLLAYNGRIFEFVHYDVVECKPFAAIGAGDGFALGALEALADTSRPDPLEHLRRAGEIAAKLSHVVRPPFIFETLEPVR